MIPNWSYSHKGVDSPSQLDWNAPLFYQGSVRLCDKSNNRARDILNSQTIPSSVTKQLSAILGKFQLTQSHGKFRNVHIYSSTAEYADGLERICYIAYEKNQLLIKEYSGPKTPNYSAYYHCLRDLLRDAKFPEPEKEIFQVPESMYSTLVEIINKIIQWRESGELELDLDAKYDTISFAKVRRYFHKAYWKIPTLNSQAVQNETAETAVNELQRIPLSLKELGEESQRAENIQELELIKDHIKLFQESLEFIQTCCVSRQAYLEWRNSLGT